MISQNGSEWVVNLPLTTPWMQKIQIALSFEISKTGYVSGIRGQKIAQSIPLGNCIMYQTSYPFPSSKIFFIILLITNRLKFYFCYRKVYNEY